MAEKMHFKALTFISGILMILLSVAFIALSVLVVFPFFQLFFDSSEGAEALASMFLGIIILPMLFLLVAVMLVMFFCYIILGILMIVSAFKNDTVFERKKGFIIFTIVMDFVLAFLFLIMGGVALTSSESLGIGVIATFIVAGVEVICGILKIVDISLHKKRMNKLEASKANVVEVEREQVNFDALKQDGKSAEPSDAERKLEELSKLEGMKKNGLVTDEEYQKRKDEILGGEQ